MAGSEITAPEATSPPCERDRFLSVGDRRLCYAEYGARTGFPVVALHGTPGSRLKFAIADVASQRLGLRLISLDRWGYGRSDPHPEPSLATFADDVRLLADSLGLSRFGLIGISGGAPFASATASALETRVERLALVSPVGPIHGLGNDELRAFHAFCFRALPNIPGGATLMFQFYRSLLSIAPKSAVMLASLASLPADRALMRSPEIRPRLIEAFKEALSQSLAGGTTDLSLFSRPWTMRLDRIRAETRIWLGTADRSVPHAAVRRLAAGMPGASLTLLEGEGHFWIARGYAEVLRWIGGADVART